MIEFYYRQMCPYSKKVNQFIDENGLRTQIQYHELSESRASEQTLQDLTGRQQVPCLVVDGKPLLESDDIIAWLKLNKTSLLKNSPSEEHGSRLH